MTGKFQCKKHRSRFDRCQEFNKLGPVLDLHSNIHDKSGLLLQFPMFTPHFRLGRSDLTVFEKAILGYTLISQKYWQKSPKSSFLKLKTCPVHPKTPQSMQDYPYEGEFCHPNTVLCTNLTTVNPRKITKFFVD